MTALTVHPLCALVPDMSAAEYAMLRDDVQKVGRIIEPIVIIGSQILDGRNRYKVHQETGAPFTTREHDPAIDGTPADFVYSRTVHRSISKSQRAMLVVSLTEYGEGIEQGKQRKAGNLKQGEAIPDTGDRRKNVRAAEKFAKITGVSASLIERAARLKRDGVPELQAAVESGVIVITEALAYVDLPKKTQVAIAKEPDRKKRHYRAVDATTRQTAQHTSKERKEKAMKAPNFAEVFINQLAHAMDRLHYDCNIRTADEMVDAYFREVDETDIATWHRLECIKPLMEAIIRIDRKRSQPDLRAVK